MAIPPSQLSSFVWSEDFINTLSPLREVLKQSEVLMIVLLIGAPDSGCVLKGRLLKPPKSNLWQKDIGPKTLLLELQAGLRSQDRSED